MNYHQYCDALEFEVERIADAFASTGAEFVVTSCPGWCTGDVVEHLGRIHRWAEELVRRRAAERVATATIELAPGDVTPEWLRAGGRALVSTLRDADPDEAMWAWGPDHHVRFWSRRQLHETLVHRMDVELAAGIAPVVTPSVAVDAIDEFLTNLLAAGYFSPKVKELRGTGERLGVRALGSDARWTVTLLADRFDVARGDGAVDAEILGAPLDLLLALYRRRPLDGSRVRVEGDVRLADFWIAHSALE